jgi:hypothetical protein
LYGISRPGTAVAVQPRWWSTSDAALASRKSAGAHDQIVDYKCAFHHGAPL